MGWGGGALPRGTCQAIESIYKLEREWFRRKGKATEADGMMVTPANLIDLAVRAAPPSVACDLSI